MSDYRGREPYQEMDLDDQIDVMFEHWRDAVAAGALFLFAVACGVVAAIEAGVVRW